ncbi:MAG TPA: primosomal protein N' [Dehalococcoidia bacterium]|nr:primosomal protein N' [Dehalococcoidia bacterium]
MSLLKFVEVAVDSPGSGNRTFTYSMPVGLILELGHSVIVPFGNQTKQGIIFGFSDTSDLDSVRKVLELTDSNPLIDPIRLELARWISQQYFCTLFQACSLMFPPGARKRKSVWLSVASGVEISELKFGEFQTSILKYLSSRNSAQLEKVIAHFGERARRSVSRLIEKQVVVPTVKESSVKVRVKYEKLGKITKSGKLALMEGKLLKAPKQLVALTYLSNDEDTIRRMAILRSKFGSSSINSLISKGYLHQEQLEVERDPLNGKLYAPAQPVNLSDSQTYALEQIYELIEKPSIKTRAVLLHGVTGSGKTEVYLEAVSLCISQGKSSLVLVPEIALTPQTIERFSSRFPGKIAVLHSGLTVGERFDQWRKIKANEYQVVIGSRSSIFAPLSNLGLIIIDEEHEWTYKQNDGVPRYHARDVAMQLAGLTSAAVILGSASPDIESYLRAKRGRYRLVELNQRYRPTVNGTSGRDGRLLAEVNIVDMRAELKSGNNDIFSRQLIAELESTINNGNQAIFFINKRGFSSFVQCNSCGYVAKCRNCDVSLTFHAESQLLICHYCAQKRRNIENCLECRSDSIGRYGVGTQLVTEKLNKLYPDVVIDRWDSDAITRHSHYGELLDRFRSGQSQIVVGTQLISKGHHLPNVTLVGVVSADVGLGLPDFRASERVFQTLCQVAGRAGRGVEEGKVIIQTYQPDHYAIKTAATQNYQSFFDIESKNRRNHVQPPYSKIIRLLRQDVDDISGQREAEQLAKLLGEQKQVWGLSDTEILGPTQAFPSRVRGRYRWQLILRGPNPRTLLETISLPGVSDERRSMKRGWVLDVDSYLSI